jgi:hypothetical protein
VPKKLSMDEEIALSGRIFQNRVGKHMKAHLLSPAYAEGVAEEINKEAGILTGLHLIGVRLLLQASFGSAQQLGRCWRSAYRKHVSTCNNNPYADGIYGPVKISFGPSNEQFGLASIHPAYYDHREA